MIVFICLEENLFTFCTQIAIKVPHILEINARSWLGRYERELGHKVTLADVPASFWEKIQKMGFDAVWLMGVWKRSPAAQKIARESEDILNQVRASKPDFNKDDIDDAMSDISKDNGQIGPRGI